MVVKPHVSSSCASCALTQRTHGRTSLKLSLNGNKSRKMFFRLSVCIVRWCETAPLLKREVKQTTRRKNAKEEKKNTTKKRFVLHM